MLRLSHNGTLPDSALYSYTVGLALSSPLASSGFNTEYSGTLVLPPFDPENPDHLHSLRKNAKLARYIAENAPKSAKTPRRLAASFESVQEAGGHWHDWLVLAEIAAGKVGPTSPLTKAFTQRCRLALTIYQRHLRETSA